MKSIQTIAQFIGLAALLAFGAAAQAADVALTPNEMAFKDGRAVLDDNSEFTTKTIRVTITGCPGSIQRTTIAARLHIGQETKSPYQRVADRAPDQRERATDSPTKRKNKKPQQAAYHSDGSTYCRHCDDNSATVS